MKYYITADIHGFYTEFHKALDEAGYFTDPGPRRRQPASSAPLLSFSPGGSCLRRGGYGIFIFVRLPFERGVRA